MRASDGNAGGNSGPLLHLNYHEIRPERSPYLYSLSTAEFEEHVRVAAAPGAGVRAKLRITFDDGHRTQFDEAFPVLERSGVKAVFFVTAGFTETEPQYLTWSQLRELADAGHEIQAHGWRHGFLTLASEAELIEELRRPKETIEDRIGRAVRSLSFPGGRFDRRVLNACRAAGYVQAFTSEPWPRSWVSDGMTLFGRVAIQNNTTAADLVALMRTGGEPPAAARLKHGIKRSLRRALGEERYHKLWLLASRGSGAGPERNAGAAAGSGEQRESKGALSVYLLDLLAAVPYYEGELCAALRRQGAAAVLGATTYYLDRDAFARRGLSPDPGGVDLVGRMGRLPAALRRPLKLAENLVNLTALALRFAVRPPDILHAQYLSLVTKGLPFELWLLAWARKRGARVVYTAHDRLPHDTGSRHAETFRRVYHSADALICHTAEMAERLTAEFGVEPRRIWTIPHGPLFGDCREIPAGEARRMMGIAPERRVVLCQGIIKPYKGVPFLLEAWPEVARRAPEAQLVIAGTCPDGELLASIESLARAAGGVRLDIRYISEDELAAYYSLADVVVYPYREITTSGAVMTGLARRKPIVATRQPAFQGLLEDGRNARLVEFGDHAGMAEALVSLLVDARERATLSAGVRSTLAALPGWDAIAEMTLRRYRSLLGPHSHG